jgi:hypothetical protein
LSAIWPKEEGAREKVRRLMRGHGYSRLLAEFGGVIRSSRRTESRDVMGNGKVGLGARVQGLTVPSRCQGLGTGGGKEKQRRKQIKDIKVTPR